MKFDITISGNGRILVKTLDFKLPEKHITFLLGESGIGKSLVARALYGLINPLELTVSINNQTYMDYVDSDFCVEIQNNSFFVFQEPSSHLNPLMKISDQLNEGSIRDASKNLPVLKSLWPESHPEKIKELIDIYPRPYRPSGGEKQRILLAMALKKISASDPSKRTLFIFDEPTGSLDNTNRDVFLDLLFSHFRRRPMTILFISHDYSMISTIYTKYSDLLGSISFRELARTKDGQISSEFSSKTYLNWLDKLNISPASRHLQETPSMSLKSGFKIFDHEFTIVQKPDMAKAVSLNIYKSDLVYLKAGSGAGKTTLAKILTGINRAQNLQLNVDGIYIDHTTPIRLFKKKIWADKMGMIFQHADEALNLNSRVRDIFSGLPAKKRPAEDELYRQLKYFFDESLPESFLNQKIDFLSGGQKQRLNILRTFLLNTDVIILDEPLNGLDFKSMCKIIDIILKMKDEGRGVLLISHNEEIFDKIIPEERRYYLLSTKGAGCKD